MTRDSTIKRGILRFFQRDIGLDDLITVVKTVFPDFDYKNLGAFLDELSEEDGKKVLDALIEKFA